MDNFDQAAHDLELALPVHEYGLELEHNPHAVLHESVEQFTTESANVMAPQWVNENDRLVAMDYDELWTLHWHPKNAVSSHYIAASSLPVLLRLAADVARKAAAG